MNRDLVLLKWVDSYGCGPSWREMDDIKPKTLTCYSVGFVVTETEESIVIVPHISPSGIDGMVESGCGDMTIPKCSIVERKVIHYEK